MNEMFERNLDPILEFKKANCAEPVPVCELNSVISLCNLLDCFATKENGVNPADSELLETFGKMWFMFWYILLSVVPTTFLYTYI